MPIKKYRDTIVLTSIPVLFYRFISFLVSQNRYLRTGRKILSVLFA